MRKQTGTGIIKAVQIRGRYGFFCVYFVEEIKTSGSVRNQVAGGFPTYPSISNKVAWKHKPSLCHPESLWLY
jgi:hypothetical protein